eukprot:scaffold3259_cov373-Prasinococcus_capsulatus_cf.AAC.9
MRHARSSTQLEKRKTSVAQAPAREMKDAASHPAARCLRHSPTRGSQVHVGHPSELHELRERLLELAPATPPTHQGSQSVDCALHGTE